MSIAIRFPLDFPSMVGDRVSLRELNESDIPGWYSRATDQESAHLSGDPIPRSLDEGQAWLSKHQLRYAKQQALRWAITVEPAAGSIGTVGLSLPFAGSDRAELGLILVEADVLEHNVACRRVLENCGFSFVLSFTEQLPSDPRPVTVFHYEARNKGK